MAAERVEAGSITKQADAALAQWGDAIRSGNSVTLDSKLSGIYFLKDKKVRGTKLEDGLIEEIDHIVGALQQPMKRVVKRYYLDEVKNHRYVYYKKDGRTIKEKSESEGMTVHDFNDYLRIARHVVFQKMSDKELL